MFIKVTIFLNSFLQPIAKMNFHFVVLGAQVLYPRKALGMFKGLNFE